MVTDDHGLGEEMGGVICLSSDSGNPGVEEPTPLMSAEDLVIPRLSEVQPKRGHRFALLSRTRPVFIRFKDGQGRAIRPGGAGLI